MHTDTKKMLAKSPEYQGSASRIYSSGDSLKIAVMQDGTHTLAQVTYNGGAFVGEQAIATGHAKRKLTDKHNDEIGTAIALHRMFSEAAEVYAKKIEHLMSPEHKAHEGQDGYTQVSEQEETFIRQMKEVARAEAKEAKNARRREARALWYLKQNPDVDDAEVAAWLARTFGDTKPWEV